MAPPAEVEKVFSALVKGKRAIKEQVRRSEELSQYNSYLSGVHLASNKIYQTCIKSNRSVYIHFFFNLVTKKDFVYCTYFIMQLERF